MPERGLDSERVLPCLLDRLTDHYPRAKKEGRQHRVIALRQYKESVLRDLTWLLNTMAHAGADELDEFEHARDSVLCYGAGSLSGEWASNRSAEDLERKIRRAILTFEPRILRDTLEVRLVKSGGQVHEHGVVCLEIAGELWATPIPEHLYIRTEVDLETGDCELA